MTSYDGEPRKQWSTQDFVRAGQTLAHFHTAGEHLRDQRVPPRGQLPGFLDKARQKLQSAPTSPDLIVKQRVLEELTGLREATNFVQKYERVPKVVVHGDFCDRNVVWQDCRCTLINLELCGMEIALFDLVFFGCEFIKARPDSQWGDVFNALVNGYREVRALDVGEGDVTKVVLLHTMVYRFYDAPGDPDWATLAEKVLSWQ